jgi:hypothetical protein
MEKARCPGQGRGVVVTRSLRISLKTTRKEREDERREPDGRRPGHTRRNCCGQEAMGVSDQHDQTRFEICVCAGCRCNDEEDLLRAQVALAPVSTTTEYPPSWIPTMATASLIADSTQISQGAEAVSDLPFRRRTQVSRQPRRKSTKLMSTHLSTRIPKFRSC